MAHVLPTADRNRSAPQVTSQVPSRALPWFLGITLFITWGIAFGYTLLPDFMAALFGPMEGEHPLYFVMTWSPGIAGVVLVLAPDGGFSCCPACRWRSWSAR